MDHPEKLTTMSTQYTWCRQTSKNIKSSGIFYSPLAIQLEITKRKHYTC